MSGVHTLTISAARTSDGLLAKIEGWGTMRESPALHEFGLRCLADDACNLVVDLSHCDYLDSTFLGCLVDLHTRFTRASASFSIAAPPGARKRLLAPLKLDRVLTVVETAPSPTSEWATLCSGEIEPRDVGQHMLDCHRQLVQLDEDNEAAFGPIVQRLASELGQE